MQKIYVKRGKINTFLEKRAHKLETLGGIYKKNATMLEISLLKNCKKLSSASPQNWSSFYQKIT